MNNREFLIARVRLRMLTTEEGGRNAPFFSFTYVPQFLFTKSSSSPSPPSRNGQILLIDRDEMCPGAQGEAVVRFRLVPNDARPLPLARDSFKILEGAKTVGEGVVIELLDELPAYRRKEPVSA